MLKISIDPAHGKDESVCVLYKPLKNGQVKIYKIFEIGNKIPLSLRIRLWLINLFGKCRKNEKK